MPSLARTSSALALVVLGLAAYANAPWGAFHFDDAHAVVENPAIGSLGGALRFFTDAGAFSVLPQNQSYRPILLLTYAATAQLTGVRAAPFLVVNLLVHLGCVLLVWQVVRELAQALGHAAEPTARLAAALFAVHPLGSECVNYVSARSESLSAAFSLAALLYWLRSRRGAGRMWPATIFMTLAVLTKIVAGVLPFFALLVERVAPRAGETWRARLGRIAWLLAPAVVASIVVGRMTPVLARRSASSFSRWTWFRSELPALLHYVRLFIWPVGQSADADYPVAVSFGEPRVWLAALVLAAALVLVLRARPPWLALGLGWFLLQLAPTSFFPLAEVVNEHRPYLASAGLCALAAAALVRAGLSRPLVGALLAVLVIVTLQRNRVWRSEETLWADVVAGAPLSGRAQMNYGLALFSDGKLAAAEPHLREAVRLWPGYSYAHINLGNWLLATGHVGEALEHLDRAVALQPDLFWAPYYRGVAAERLSAPPAERAAWFRRALALSPGFAPARAGLARAEAAGGS